MLYITAGFLKTLEINEHLLHNFTLLIFVNFNKFLGNFSVLFYLIGIAGSVKVILREFD